MNFGNKITVITPESFNEFISEIGDAVELDALGNLTVTEVHEGEVTRIKVFADGHWSTVETELVTFEYGEDDDPWNLPEMGEDA